MRIQTFEIDGVQEEIEIPENFSEFCQLAEEYERENPDSVFA